MHRIVQAIPADAYIIRQIAYPTWKHTYPTILSQAQIDYMLEVLYSEEVLRHNLMDPSRFTLILYEADQPAAFAEAGEHPAELDAIRLHKLYIHPTFQKKGYGKLLIDAVSQRALENNLRAIELNVNRYNPAVEFYKHLGFREIREEDIPIGPYWMNDYVMRLTIDQRR